MTSNGHRLSGVMFAALFAVMGWQNAGLAQQGAESLKQDFQAPPPDTRPGCYWYWINDNISTQGITRDLEAMARVGIGRAYIGHIFERQKDTDTPVGDVKFMSEAWWDALQWAVREADRCGVEIGFFNSPGWSQSGGPWIKPSQSMRYLGHSEVRVTGGQEINVVLPVPQIDTFPAAGGSQPTRHGPDFTAQDFQDVKVIAFRQVNGETGRAAGTVSSFSGGTSEALRLFDNSDETFVEFPANRETSLTIHLPRDPGTTQPVQSVLLKPLDDSYTLLCTAEESDDGKSFRELTSYREERGHQGPKRKDAIVVPLGKVSGEYVRLRLTFTRNKVRVAEVALSREPLLGGYVRKQLGETSPNPQPPDDAYLWDSQPSPAEGTAIRSDEVVDLTDKMEAGGRLRWGAPPGKWTILRMGMIPIGTMCAPCSPESRGLEIDKMNREHASAIFDGMVGEFLKRTPEEARKALRYVIADSYETGPQNWTDGLVEKFTKRFGYSPARYLPVMTGRIVDSPEVSDRFLWDLRKLIVESVAREYVGGLREIANRNGLTLWLENYGHWGFISEFLFYGSQTDQVGGEIWESGDPINNVECRAAASSAHIYGKKEVYAEAFTSSRNFRQYPATLKRWCDWMFGAGINHAILHVYIHQPGERKPGIIEWFGTAFNRHNTWFEQSKGFIDYMRRGAVLLKAGLPVADVAYYIGENPPSMEGPMDPPLPDGYDFDYINSDVLVNRTRVENGRITLPDGVSYSVLVLPKENRMLPEVAEAVKKLVAEGAVVIGSRPERSPSLQGYPDCDARVRAVAEELWGRDGEAGRPGSAGRAYGKGRVYTGVSLVDVFGNQHVTPDVDVVSTPSLRSTVAGAGTLGVNATGGILFKHRKAPTCDIYFLANTSGSNADLQVSFRQNGRQPFLWNAVTGEVCEVRAFHEKEGGTVVPLRLQASESVYVVFGASDAGKVGGEVPRSEAASNTPDYATLAPLDGPWSVRFQGSGAPGEVTFDRLSDWSEHPDQNVRYFSGTATYERHFTLSERPNKRVVLDLGSVGVIATVLVNDREAGTVWTNPWTIDITDYVREGENNLKVQVTNTWNNSLLGDAEGIFGKIRNEVSQPYGFDKKHPLLPSGLLGPVSLKAER